MLFDDRYFYKLPYCDGKEIHFYTYSIMNDMVNNCATGISYCVDWLTTNIAIATDQSCICTTQVGLLSTDLLVHGYRIFIHETSDSYYEIKMGINPGDSREIHTGINLFTLWKNGGFDNVARITGGPMEENTEGIEKNGKKDKETL